jgi:hypothetical protein
VELNLLQRFCLYGVKSQPAFSGMYVTTESTGFLRAFMVPPKCFSRRMIFSNSDRNNELERLRTSLIWRVPGGETHTAIHVNI